MTTPEAVVIGAGPAGVATGLALKDAGVTPLIVDAADTIASTWRGRYDRLRLNTCRPFSHLPDRPFARGVPMFPSRDQLIEHVEHHAVAGGLEFQLRTRVARIEREGGGWTLETAGEPIRSRQVVVATGYEAVPNLPGWAEAGAFGGWVLHSSEYRNAEPFAGKQVLVVGAGSSGMEIAHDLATHGAAKVWVSVRTPPNVILREGRGGLPGDMIGVMLLHLPTRVGDALGRLGQRMDVGDLAEYGLPVPEEGIFSRLNRLGVAPTIVDGEAIDSIRSGSIEIVPAVKSVGSDSLELTDGRRLGPDVIMCATGYRRNLGSLVGHLGILDERERPSAVGEVPAAPGLRFIGYVPRPGGLGYMSKQAKRAARAIARELSARRPVG